MLLDFLVVVYLATVVKVHDGDTVTIVKQNTTHQEHVRLNRIDAPELNQPYGIESRDYLSELVLNQTVDIDPACTDMYGRVVAEIRILEPDNSAPFNVNSEMVKSGFAWRYPQYDRDKGSQLPILEKDSRDLKLGLWAGDKPKAPWLFRKEQKRKIKGMIHTCK